MIVEGVNNVNYIRAVSVSTSNLCPISPILIVLLAILWGNHIDAVQNIVCHYFFLGFSPYGLIVKADASCVDLKVFPKMLFFEMP